MRLHVLACKRMWRWACTRVEPPTLALIQCAFSELHPRSAADPNEPVVEVAAGAVQRARTFLQHRRAGASTCARLARGPSLAHELTVEGGLVEVGCIAFAQPALGVHAML